MNLKQPIIWVSLFFMFFLTHGTLEAQEPVILDSKMKPGISNDMRIEELKVRWKKAALENCTGIPCVVAPSFTCGTSTITDIDGNSYNTVQIGTQCWTKENLRVRKYNDGTAIPFNTSGGTTGNGSGQTWGALAIGAHTLYAHDSTAAPSNLLNYGYLYNYYAAAGIITVGGTPTKNICPTGYHVPTDTEWTTLTDFLGGLTVAGGKMKETGTTLWNTPNIGADNTSGFSALPGGYRNLDGSFNVIGNFAFFWSATEFDFSNAWFRNLINFNGFVYRFSNGSKTFGASVRCLRD